ncbi:winged helix-turn-helix transcriptional regulator [Cyanobium sp. ATX 6A2]|uniref:winged helix-turn-helix transcriptional regulator n=1 Tax=Cyanobium sp. ATX 6A2 TaxID=2823700 RepID=UPI0020CFA030|nr:winged helix-turn-helix transcriptional regulator [Cyanobium sp. ATX 6A2]
MGVAQGIAMGEIPFDHHRDELHVTVGMPAEPSPLRMVVAGKAVHPEVPPRVEYALTGKGLELISVLEELHAWGTQNRKFTDPIPDQSKLPQR